MSERARTHIDRTSITLANRWLERSWSTFLGTTESMRDRANDVEWLRGGSREFGVRIGNDEFGSMAFGDADWSEQANASAATLVQCASRDGLQLRMLTHAFHDSPVIAREVRVLNANATAITLDTLVIDDMMFDVAIVDGGRVAYTPSGDPSAQSFHEFSAVQGDRVGLVVACENGLKARVDSTRLRIATAAAVDIPGSTVWNSPTVAYIPFVGSAAMALAMHLNPFYNALRAMRVSASGMHRE